MRAHLLINRIENLEPRLLLASFASLNAAGVLSVVGNSNNNVINVVYSLNKVKVTRDGSNLYFDKTKVKKIWAEGFGGNDKITIGVSLPSTLIGDAGNDTLIGNAKGDSINGGSGDDRLIPGGSGEVWDQINHIDPGSGKDVIDYSASQPGSFDLGFQYIITHTAGGKTVSIDSIPADAGEGNLTILLTPGNDTFGATGTETHWTIDAGAGNDKVYLIQASVFSVNAGAGNDIVSFNYDDGIHSVYGGSGNDLIDDASGYGGTIVCDGGSGYDTYNLEPDIEAMSNPIYDVTIPPGVEAFNLAVRRGLVVHGNELSNNITLSARNVTVYGNGGNDRLITRCFGHPEDGNGHGLLDGGSGNDTLIGQPEPGWTSPPIYVFKGGGGTDTADFSARTDNLNITLDNVANDGATSEHDNVMADVENILGGGGSDKLIGNPFANLLKGGAGNDTLYGGAGNDTLDGGSGRDLMFGQDGNDRLLAKDNRTDSLDGGNGFDTAQRDKSNTITDQVLSIEAFI